MSKTKQKLVEIARSYAYKMNIGNFQSVDFFCSEKAEVLEEEAEKKSEELYQFCKREVLKSVKDYSNDKKAEGLKNWSAKKQEIYNADSKAEEVVQELKEAIIDNF